MNYKVGDTVRVVHAHAFSPWWPWRRFWLPRPGFSYGRAKGSGTVIEVIVPSQQRGLTNAGGYKVQLKNGTIHYYSEAELRPSQ
jgi:hypothetical protein